jgi:hypothetical protein
MKILQHKFPGKILKQQSRLGLLLFFVLCGLATNAEIPDSSCNCRWKERGANGRIKAVGRYKNNMKHGTWAEYDSSGTIIYKEFYKKGKMMHRFNYVNGKKAERIDWKGRVRKYPACGCY